MDQRTAMAAALEAAQECLAAGEVPVGAAVWQADRILAVAGNRRERDRDPAGHAEVVALRMAAQIVGDWRMPQGTWISVTLEPCPMCAYCIREARVTAVAYGVDDPQRGAAGSLYHLLGDARLGPGISVLAGVETQAASRLLERFFAERRGSFGGGVSEPG